MAKSRAQRKAEQRRRAQQGADESRAQHETQVPESADVVEAELAEQGADLDSLKGRAPSRADVGRPAPSGEAVEEEAASPEKVSRRAKAAEERDREQRRKESERRRAPKEAPAERRQRGGIAGFIASCWAELKKVQWPDRETLIQASAITLIFIAAMAAYLGVLDAIFNFLVQRIL